MTQLAQQQFRDTTTKSEPPKPPGRVLRENVPNVQVGLISDYHASIVDFSEIDEEAKNAYRTMVFDLHAGKKIDKKERRMILFECEKRMHDLEADLQLLAEIEYAKTVPARVAKLQQAHDATREPRIKANEEFERACYRAQGIINEAQRDLASAKNATMDSARALQEGKIELSQIRQKLECDYLVCSKCGSSKGVSRQTNKTATTQLCICGETLELKAGIRSTAAERVEELQAEFETLGRLIDDTRKPLRDELYTEAEAEENHLANCRRSGMTAEQKIVEWKKWKRENPVLKAAGEIINESAQRRAEILHEIPQIRDGELFDIQNIEFF